MKKVMTGIALAALGGIALAQGPAPGDTAPAGIEPGSFQKLDINRDGLLSRIEASSDSVLTRAFDAADKNADGKLDAMEFRAVMAK